MKKLTTTLLFLILSLFLISCGSETKSEQKIIDSKQSVEARKVLTHNNTAGEISFTVYDTQGTLHNSSKWIGKKPVVINIWGTWCPPCRAEIPALVKAYKEYKNKGVEILGLAVGRDTPQKVNQFAAQNNVNWVMMMGGQGIQSLVEKYQIRSVPSTIFIDKNGKVMKVWSPHSNSMVEAYVGGLHYEQFTKMLDSLLTI